MLHENAKFNFYSELSFSGSERDPRSALITQSYSSTGIGVRSWLLHAENQFIAACQSDQTIGLKDVNLQFHFIIQPSGGTLGTQSRDIDSILNKKSVNRIINNDTLWEIDIIDVGSFFYLLILQQYIFYFDSQGSFLLIFLH